MNKKNIINVAKTIPTLPERAFYIASMAHLHQKDKQGCCYSWHVVRVGMKGRTDNEKIVGFLHDLIEDTDFTIHDLLELGFTHDQVRAIELLTKRDQKYDEYLRELGHNSLALAVKWNDIDDNEARLWSITSQSVRTRLSHKYAAAKGILYHYFHK